MVYEDVFVGDGRENIDLSVVRSGQSARGDR